MTRNVEFGSQLNNSLETMNATGKLYRVRWSQNFPDAVQRLNTRTLRLVSMCAVALFRQVYSFVLQSLGWN
jgi:hypothetical protein